MDVFLPFADLNQKKACVLDESQPYFLGYQMYYLFEFLAVGCRIFCSKTIQALGLMSLPRPRRSSESLGKGEGRCDSANKG